MARWLLYALVLALGLCLSAVSVAAATVDFVVTPVKDTINWDDTAIYQLKIINYGPASTLELKPSNLNWGLVQVQPSAIFVPTNGFAEAELKISPPTDIKAGPYVVEVIAYSSSAKKVVGSTLVKMNVISEPPHLTPQWGISKQITPGVGTDVNLIIKNDGNLPVPETKAVLSSPLLSGPVNLNIPALKSGEAKLVWNSKLEIPTNTPVGDYQFDLKIYKDGNLLSKNTYTVQVAPKPAVKASVTKTKGFLGTGYTVVLENIGNTEANDYYKIQIPSWQAIFLQSKIKPQIQKLESLAQVAWPFQIGVGESKVIKYQISYVPLFALLLAILMLGYVFGYYFRQELLITKEVIGSEKALKVRLSVKNNSGKPLQKVVIEDHVPTPLKMVGADHKPLVTKSSDGVAKLFWKYDVLWPGEEKTITYDIKSSLNVVGSVILPPAKGWQNTGGEKKIFASNSVLIRSKPSLVIEEEE